MKFMDIPQAISDGGYRVHVEWTGLEENIKRWSKDGSHGGMEIEPDFQRGHIWSPEQRIRYIEAKLANRVPSDIIRWNCPGWMGDFRGPLQCVDGLQRLTSARLFLQDVIPAYGLMFSEFEGRLPRHVHFEFMVNNLSKRKDVLRWYLELNASGTPHSAAELERVANLLDNADAVR